MAEEQGGRLILEIVHGVLMDLRLVVPHHDLPPAVNNITGDIVGAAIEVHRAFGPGLVERVYRDSLAHELQLRGRVVDVEVPAPVVYKGKRFEGAYRVDVLVEKKVIVEVKSVEEVHPVHRAQLWTYLKLSGLNAGLLINFNERLLKDGVHRVVRTE